LRTGRNRNYRVAIPSQTSNVSGDNLVPHPTPLQGIAETTIKTRDYAMRRFGWGNSQEESVYGISDAF